MMKKEKKKKTKAQDVSRALGKKTKTKKTKTKKNKKKNKNRRPEMRLGPWVVKQKQKQNKFELPATPSVGARLSGTKDASGVVWAHSRHRHPPNPPCYVKT